MNPKRRAWLLQQAVTAAIFFLLFAFVFFISFRHENPVNNNNNNTLHFPGNLDFAVQVHLGSLPRRFPGSHVGSPVADVAEWGLLPGLIQPVKEGLKRNDGWVYVCKEQNALDRVKNSVSFLDPDRTAVTKDVVLSFLGRIKIKDDLGNEKQKMLLLFSYRANRYSKEDQDRKFCDVFFQALQNIKNVEKDEAPSKIFLLVLHELHKYQFYSSPLYIRVMLALSRN